MHAITTYFHESLQELRLVRWPTRQQAVRLSVIVFFFTIVSAVLFGVIDLGLQSIVHFVLSTTF